MKVTDLYRRVPSVMCRGLCADACGVILLQQSEVDAIEAKHGPLRQAQGLKCPYLEGGRCSIYEDRPLVCRMYGAIPQMPCPFGCEPWRPLPAIEADELIAFANTIDPRVRSFNVAMDAAVRP